MELIGAVIVGALLVIAGLLVALYLQGEQRHEQAEAHHERAQNHHDERRAQDFEATRAIVETLHLVGHAIAAEVRETNRQQRNDLRLANRLPRVIEPPPRTWRTPPATSRSRSSRRADEETSAPHEEADPPSLPLPVPAPPLPSFDLHDDEQTPPSGWTAEQMSRHFADASGAEEHPQ